MNITSSRIPRLGPDYTKTSAVSIKSAVHIVTESGRLDILGSTLRKDAGISSEDADP